MFKRPNGRTVALGGCAGPPVLLSLLILLSLSGVALAQAGAGAVTAPLRYDLSWWTVDGGGVGGLEATPYTLDGTAGQPDATGWAGGGYTLAGGSGAARWRW